MKNIDNIQNERCIDKVEKNDSSQKRIFRQIQNADQNNANFTLEELKKKSQLILREYSIYILHIGRTIELYIYQLIRVSDIK